MGGGDVISPMSLQPKGLKRGRESGWVEGCHKSNEPSAQRTKKREGEWVGGGCHKSNEPSAQRTKKREGEWVGGGMS